MHAWRFGALLLGTALLSGCVVGPDYVKPSMFMPAAWSGNSKKMPVKPAELAQWWKQLHDPLLDQLIVEAVEGNLDVAAAKARIREARATTRQQAGTLLPTLSGSSSATRSRVVASNAGGGATISNQFDAGFDASWELDLFGGNKRALEAALYSEQASEEDLRNTLLTLVGDVASYYVEAREYQALIELAIRSAKSQNQTASLTKTQYESGNSSGIDAAKAVAQAASTEANIPSYRISYAQAVHRLGVLLGKSPDVLETRLAKGGKIPAPKLDVATGIPADVLLTRPDIRLAERQLAQYTAKIGQAEANRYPSVSLTAILQALQQILATSARNLRSAGRSGRARASRSFRAAS